jgi:hypothetical protein
MTSTPCLRKSATARGRCQAQVTTVAVAIPRLARAADAKRALSRVDSEQRSLTTDRAGTPRCSSSRAMASASTRLDHRRPPLATTTVWASPWRRYASAAARARRPRGPWRRPCASRDTRHPRTTKAPGLALLAAVSFGSAPDAPRSSAREDSRTSTRNTLLRGAGGRAEREKAAASPGGAARHCADPVGPERDSRALRMALAMQKAPPSGRTEGVQSCGPTIAAPCAPTGIA